MNQFTRLNQEEVTTVAAQFNLHNISSFELLSGGSQNTNYLVTAKQGKYILCICEQNTLEEAKQLADLLAYLAANNFNTSQVVYSRDNESIISWKGKPVMLRVFLEGTIQKDLSSDLLQLIGEELAKLHQVAAPSYLRKQLGYGKEQFKNVSQYAANSEFEHWLNKVLNYMEPYFKLDLPISLIHSDVFWDNVIISEDEKSVTIMDFEEAANYYRVFDVGMTIIGICGEGQIVNVEKARHLLTGYQSAMELSKEELKSLKAFTIYAGASMTFWRHQNFNYIKPDPKMFDHYLGLKVLVDYVFELEDDCFTA